MTVGERTHYQVLGVGPGASTDEVRRAHRQLARVLHPDRLGASSPAERTLAERRMREVNAAWTTLSDPARRQDYDRELAAARTAPVGAATSTGARRGAPQPASGRPEDADDPDLAFARARAAELDPDEPELSAGHFWLLRRGPVVLAGLVAVVLFVVTAYAGSNASDESATPTTNAALDCVRRIEGREAVRVTCDSSNDGRVVTFVDRPLDCPANTSYVVLDGRLACATTDPTLLSNLPSTTEG